MVHLITSQLSHRLPGTHIYEIIASHKILNKLSVHPLSIGEKIQEINKEHDIIATHLVVAYSKTKSR